MPSNHLFQSNVSLQSFNTLGIAALARFYLRVTAIDQLQLLKHQLKQAHLGDIPCLVLGGGSNLVLTQDFPGMVLHIALMGRECIVETDEFVYVRAAAGESWHEFVQWTLAQGWGGLENLSLIPGCVGAAPIQNIGAYGVEISHYFHSLSWFEFSTEKVHTLTASDCKFGYRDSIFKHALFGKGVILDVTFALPKQWQAQINYGEIAHALENIANPTPQQISSVICSIRQSKLPDPKLLGNVGSFFKNPVVSAQLRDYLLAGFPSLVSYPQLNGQYKLAAGWLIDQLGWKGRKLGRAGVYEKQALVLVNLGGACGNEIVNLAQNIQADVNLKFGVQLEIEPVVIV